jgi:hypothetical protein
MIPGALSAQTVHPIPQGAIARINDVKAREHVEYLASDRMLGRNTPSPELDSAAEYIARTFRSLGVEPAGDGYFHTYNITRDVLRATSLAVNGREFEPNIIFVPHVFTGNGVADGRFVFVGYGLSIPDSGLDEYAGVDVRGAIVLAVAGEPRIMLERHGGVRLASISTSLEKMRTAQRKGAAGFLLLNNPVLQTSSFPIRPAGHPWPLLYKAFSEETIPYKVELSTPSLRIPSASIGGDVAEAIFGGQMEQIAGLVRRIDSTGIPASVELKSKGRFVSTVESQRIPVRNVIGIIRGSTLPDEYIVVGAHYDHVGHAAPTGKKPDGEIDSIYNGADDNASGTAGVLMLADAFASVPRNQRPARSILLLAFSGEEKGLYGSRAYAASPMLPISTNAAMINMDMIGRNNSDSISVGGTNRSPELESVVLAANAAEPFILAYDIEQYFYRSDQASFAQKGVPVLFVHSGEHADYHKVTDSPDKINYPKLAHAARFAMRLVWLTADLPTRPTYHELKTNDPNSVILDR